MTSTISAVCMHVIVNSRMKIESQKRPWLLVTYLISYHLVTYIQDKQTLTGASNLDTKSVFVQHINTFSVLFLLLYAITAYWIHIYEPMQMM